MGDHFVTGDNEHDLNDMPPYVDIVVTFRVHWASMVDTTTDDAYVRMSRDTLVDRIADSDVSYVTEMVERATGNVIRS